MTISNEMRALILQAVEAHGTPLYVYDLDRIDQNLATIRGAFGADIRIHYAGKALMNGHVLKYLKSQGCGVDTVSQQEIEIALHYGFTPDAINFTPSGAIIDEYFWAIEQGVLVHIDNLDILRAVGKRCPGAEIAIRFNPKVRSGGYTQLQVGAEDSKFGLYAEEFEAAEELVKAYGLVVKRIHVHVGSDVKTEDDFVTCWKKSFHLAARFHQTVETLDLGGGYGVKYHSEDKSVNMRELGERVGALRAAYAEQYGRTVQLMLEPGKSIVGNAGYFVVQATSKKKLPETSIVYVNSGFNHFIRPMYYGAKHFIENLSRPDAEKSNFKVVGYLCETDTFSDSAEIASVEVGDILCFHNAGAYSMSMASNYNSRLRPAEVVIQGGSAILSRRRETVQDLLIFDVD